MLARQQGAPRQGYLGHARNLTGPSCRWGTDQHCMQWGCSRSVSSLPSHLAGHAWRQVAIPEDCTCTCLMHAQLQAFCQPQNFV